MREERRSGRFSDETLTYRRVHEHDEKGAVRQRARTRRFATRQDATEIIGWHHRPCTNPDASNEESILPGPSSEPGVSEGWFGFKGRGE